MRISDEEAILLKQNLTLLKMFINRESNTEHYSDNLAFVNNMVSKIKSEEDKNIVIYNKLGDNKGYISKIYSGGHLHLFYDKYHNQVIEPGLETHIGEDFEYREVNLNTGEITYSQKILKNVSYSNNTLIVEFITK